MNQADKDAQKWMEANSKWQYRDLIKAKETGTPYYIDQNGNVITKKEEKKDED
jgi:hypothetical protein